MRVLIVSHAYVERDNHKKLEELMKISGLEIGVVYPNSWRTWHGEEKCQMSNVKCQTYSEFPLETYFGGDGGKYLYNPLQLFSTVSRFKPDLIHLEEEPFTPVAAEAALLSRLTRRQMVFFSWENIDLPLGLWRTFFEKLVFRIAKKAVAGNLEAKKRIEMRGFSGKVEVIPQFGVDTGQFFPDEKRSPSQDDSLKDRFVVGFVGRPSEVKGLDLLLGAVLKLNKSVSLLVVSSSPHLPEWVPKLVQRLGVEERVEFHLGISHKDLPGYFRKMDAFVLPSRTTSAWKEQFGRTLIEAMACGAPVVGSNSGAIPEVIGNDGFIFNEGDSEDLSKYLKMLSSDINLWKEMHERGLKAARERYSFEKIAEKTAQFYVNL